MSYIWRGGGLSSYNEQEEKDSDRSTKRKETKGGKKGPEAKKEDSRKKRGERSGEDRVK